MAIANRIDKQVAVRKQTGLGTVGSDNGQVLRRVSCIPQVNRDMYQSNEIVSHHQSTGSSYGRKSTSVALQGEYSAGTYQLLIEAMLEAGAATVSAYNVGTDVTPDSAGTFTTSAGAYLTNGLKVGMIGRWTGFASPGDANNAKNFLITSLTETVMTGVFLNGDAVVSDSSGDDVTFTPVGQVCQPPLTSHTKDYLQIEDWYSDLTDSDLFTDCIVGSMELNLPASGNATVSFGLVGRDRTLSGSQVMTSAAAESETKLMASINGVLYVNGTATPVTSLSVSIQNGAAPMSPEIGSNTPADIARDRIQVTGSFSSLLRDQVLSALFDAESDVSLVVAMAEDETATAECMSISIGKLKITSDTPNDDSEVMRTYNFIAQINHDGGSAVAWPETIITIQDSSFS